MQQNVENFFYKSPLRGPCTNFFGGQSWADTALIRGATLPNVKKRQIPVQTQRLWISLEQEDCTLVYTLDDEICGIFQFH